MNQLKLVPRMTLSVLLVIPWAIEVSHAQSAAAEDAAPTRREAELMQRIEVLEETLSSLRDLTIRLAALEAKLSGAAVVDVPGRSGNELPEVASTSPAAYGTIFTRSDPAMSDLANPAIPSTALPMPGSVLADPPLAEAPNANQPASPSLRPAQGDSREDPSNLLWGDWVPGPGFTVARAEVGELNLSGYMAARYLNQLPPDQTATDHLGRPIAVQARQDFQLHRVMLYSSGWMFDPKFKYFTFLWTVNDTTQVAVGGNLSYSFSDRFKLGLGWNGLPASRSLQGSHPYWTTYDRVMADEFFRPFFTQGLFGSGDLPGRVSYKWMVGNNNSNLDVKGTQLTRELNFAGSLTWMPTTGEFGPRGAFGDYEDHEELATRFGAGYVVSRENRQTNTTEPSNNTTLRLADSLNVFDRGTFAEGVAVDKVTYHMTAADVGIKYRGLWMQGEGYYRLLENFRADGPLPVGAVRDTGFYAQAAYMVVPKVAELYAGTSYVFSDYGRPKEFIVGGNWYPANSRNYRVNLHVVEVDESPVSSLFGFYMGKITGTVVAVGVTALY